jgi:hypothetical protein
VTAKKSTTPAPGWWAVHHHIGNDRRFALIPDEDKVLMCLGLMVAATGWGIAFETEIVTEADLTRHAIVGAASTESVLDAARLLVAAGIWTEVPGVGFDTGAAEHIAAKQDRIYKARAAVDARIKKRAQERAEALAELDSMGGADE